MGRIVINIHRIINIYIEDEKPENELQQYIRQQLEEMDVRLEHEDIVAVTNCTKSLQYYVNEHTELIQLK